MSSDFGFSDVVVSGTPKYPSKLPLVLSLLLAIASIAIYFVFPKDELLYSIIGYVLTPLGVTLSLAWGQSLDVSGRRDVWYSPDPKLITALKVLAIIGFAVGGLHMWDIASVVAARFA